MSQDATTSTPKWNTDIDTTLLRAIAERWDDPDAPDVLVGVPGATVGYLLRLVADAMEEAA